MGYGRKKADQFLHTTISSQVNQHVHIVCLDNPYPADYGGAIDMFYKIKTLAQLNVKIHLHYFSYNHRNVSRELNQYCESVTIYERKTGWKGIDLKLPYIVSSRINKKLIDNLNKDNHPILLEGLHCSGILPEINKNNRKIILRVHNNEESYYANLFKTEKKNFRKLYFAFEKYLLKKYQQNLPVNIGYACISELETDYFKNQLGLKNTHLLPPFVAWEIGKPDEGIGSYCLYHGNLAVAENEFAAGWLVDTIFSKINIPLTIAGNKPTLRLRNRIKKYSTMRLIANPSVNELNDLIKKSQINVLPSFTETGIKLKLLHALFEGRHCVVNEMMVAGTGLQDACTVANTANHMISIINRLFKIPLTHEEIEIRKTLLKSNYDNTVNAEKIIRWLW